MNIVSGIGFNIKYSEIFSINQYHPFVIFWGNINIVIDIMGARNTNDNDMYI